MLRDLYERAARLGRQRSDRTKKDVATDFRRTRQRLGTVRPVQLPYVRIVEGQPKPLFSSFRAQWIPNPSIERFHGSWWTRLRVRTGVGAGAARHAQGAQA